MASKRKPQTVPFRRKRELRTDYKKRLHLLLSRKPRIVVRLTNTQLIAQLVQFQPQGDKVIMGVNSLGLKKMGWKYSCKNFPAAYLTGLLFAKKSKEAGIEEAILDTGLRTPQKKGRIYAFLKGVLDGGMQVPHGDAQIFPDEKMIKGEHIVVLGEKATGNQFTQYLKAAAKPESMPAEFAKLKAELQ